MRVAIAVHGRYHAFDLARGLHERGHLAQVVTTYPRVVARRFLPAPLRLDCAPWLEAWRRTSDRIALFPRCEARLPAAFGRFAARRLVREADLLVGWSSASLEAIEPARQRGLKVIIERGSAHILHQTEVLSAEYARLGATAMPTPSVIIDRELEEYDRADEIAVPTRFAAETFVARGVPRERLLINPYGTDLARFAPDERAYSHHHRPRILFVGQVGARKGVVPLMRAFAALAGRASLHLVGPIEPGCEDLVKRHSVAGIVVAGPLSGDRLRRAFAEADIFCLPSIEEGFGLVLLEAMATGLPVVTTNVTGGGELIRSDQEGLLVPPGDEGALREALESLIDDSERRASIGRAGRLRVEADFQWRHYWDRAVDAYRGLLAEGQG